MMRKIASFLAGFRPRVTVKCRRLYGEMLYVFDFLNFDMSRRTKRQSVRCFTESGHGS